MTRLLPPISCNHPARFALCVALAAGLLMAQNPTNGWPRASGPPMAAEPAANQPVDGTSTAENGQYPQADPPYNPNANPPRRTTPAPQYEPPASTRPLPAQVTIPQGAFVTVRLNQTLSSDHNHSGDAFSTSLASPVIANGVVVAQRGQTLGGRVVEAEKAGRVEGTSKLRIQLTDLTLADGQQVPIQSQFVNWRGPTSVGRDAAAVAGTTGLGAAIGAAAGWGTGAAIGAGAGAAAGLIGVLLTRGRPTVIPEESLLTFRVQAPIAVVTDNAPEAFHYARSSDYGQPSAPAQPAYAAAPRVPPPPPCAGYGCAPMVYYGPAYYPYWGPSVYVFGGPRYYYRPGFYYRGYYPYRFRR